MIWHIERTKWDREQALIEESLFMTGNGYLGVRGNLEEAADELAPDSIRGMYLNGFYDIVPMVYGESAYGLPVVQDKQPRILDVQSCEVYLDGERVSLTAGRHSHYIRHLSFRRGIQERSYQYETASGKAAQLCFRRMASFWQPNVYFNQIEISYAGQIEVRSIVETAVENYSKESDPRVGRGCSKLLETLHLEITHDRICVLQQTQTSRLKQAAVVLHRLSNSGRIRKQEIMGSQATTTLCAEGHLLLDKKTVLTDELREEHPEIRAGKIADQIKDISWQEFQSKQESILDDFWRQADIEIEGDDHSQCAIRFMLFQLFQSVGRDAWANISAKGLSGEGYEGHYFWDTEIYILPLLQIIQPELARNLLDYRYRILPQARERALELGHKKGAAYAWRTISGRECSGYFPAGTAQYHINADIAYVFIQDYFYRQSTRYLLDKGFEVIVETARTWLEIGNWQEGRFMIHGVTGPDEYTAMISNNYYTNAMAKYHLRWTVRFYDLLKRQSSDEMEALCVRLRITPEEIEAMGAAAEAMYLPFDAEKGIFAQDDSFLTKPVWPFAQVPEDKYPLLLHFHPLTIYRHQVLKQADTVLAHLLLEEGVSEEALRQTYRYYERITTHDSSLSTCVYGMMAARIGEWKEAETYFDRTLDLDLEDLHHNTKDGLHMANSAGSVLSIIAGFAGYRILEEGISFRPYLPNNWKSYHFHLQYQGRSIAVSVYAGSIRFRILYGEPLVVSVYGKRCWIQEERSIEWPHSKDKNPVQSAIRAVIFDLDGVLTETSEQHYQAWKELAGELGFVLPETVRDAVRGISRQESLQIVLEAGKMENKYNKLEKKALTERKNQKYIDLIHRFSPAQVNHGAVELLQFLRQKGLRIGLASSSCNAAFLIRAMGLEQYFDAVVDPVLIQRGKPAPDIFLAAADQLGVAPETCIGVEDAYAGILSIQQAGMTPVGIGRPEQLPHCLHVFTDLPKVQEFLQEFLY